MKRKYTVSLGIVIYVIVTANSSCSKGKTSCPLEDFAGPILDKLGEGSNWIGGRRSGSKQADEDEKDSKGRYPLGDTRIPGVNPFDALARQHDIQDWVNWHAPKGTWVRVECPSGLEEFYMSRGEKNNQHHRDVAIAYYAISSGSPLACLHMLNHMPTTHRPPTFLELDDLKRKYPAKKIPKKEGGYPRAKPHLYDPKDPFKSSRRDVFPPPPDDGSGGGSAGKQVWGVSIDSRPVSIGKGGTETKREALKSRHSDDVLSWSFEIPGELK